MIRKLARWRTVAIAAGVALLLGAAVVFKPPTAREQKAAAGKLDDLPPALRRAFAPGEGFFNPVPKPGESDWLANHVEEGQTFDQFVDSEPNRPEKKRNKLYYLPLGKFDAERSPALDDLQRFGAAYFAIEVKILPPLDLDKAKITSRKNQYTGKTQLLTRDILRLLAGQLPDDAYALLGITMVDLYPDPRWNYVFGEASLRERVGVYSFARYDPAFFDGKRGPDWKKLLLRRSCKVLAHETTHMFGIQHCIYYHCLINGCNNLDEDDATPLHLCPVDLRKLQWSIGFDVVARYRKLKEFAKAAGFEDEEKWLGRRIEYIEGK